MEKAIGDVVSVDFHGVLDTGHGATTSAVGTD